MNPTLDLLKVKADLILKSTSHSVKENEVVDILGDEFPSINNDLERLSNPSNVYSAIQYFADFTKLHITIGNFKEVKHCFDIAEKLLKNGNSTVKNAIENGYLFSISRIIDMTNPISKKVKEILPELLKKEYNRQVCSSGI